MFFHYIATTTTYIYPLPYTTLFRSVRDGVFSKPATWGGTSSSWEELMLGLKKGDRGEAVEALQELIRLAGHGADRKSTRLNSSHVRISYAVFCLKKKKKIQQRNTIV